MLTASRKTTTTTKRAGKIAAPCATIRVQISTGTKTPTGLRGRPGTTGCSAGCASWPAAGTRSCSAGLGR
jgi:hypothetical protein